MAHDVLPSRDLELQNWARVFDEGISADPSALGLSPADAAEFHVAAVAFAACMMTLADPSTRTRPAVQGKTSAKQVLKAVARRLIRVVSACATVTDPERINLGLPVRAAPDGRGRGARVGRPASRPMLILDHFGRVRIVDAAASHRRGRPAGTIGALVFATFGHEPPRTPDEMRFAGLATRHRHAVPLPSGSAGKTLWVMAQWVNERGEAGPTSAPVRAMIAA